jgi:probable rRNA maturation factor
MAIAITIQNRQRTKRVNVAVLKRIVTNLLQEQLELASADLGISLVGDKEMTRINEHFLQHKGSTDVITFDHAEPETRNPKLETVCVDGELFICVDEAVRHAKRFKTTWQSEVVRYVVHGVLHLLGHDDKHAKLRLKMMREENRLVTKLVKEFSFARMARS